MTQVIAAIPPRRKQNDTPEKDCVLRVQAELVGLGGGILLALCMLITGAFVMIIYTPSVSDLQRFIAFVLFMSAWAYFLDSVTEQLSLDGETINFKAALSRARSIPISELEGMYLIHHGLNLENGIGAIEFRQQGRKPDRVSLGPCWQWKKLEAFMGSIDKIM